MRRSRPSLLLAALLAAAAGTGGCGTEGIEVARNSPDREGAEIFHARCSGCHTFSVAGAQGGASEIGSREYKDGPSFDQRTEDAADVLFAIENGGFSSGPMPQNIVVGEEARKVADFVAKYSGKQAERPPDPTGGEPAGGSTPAGAEPPPESQ